MLSNKAAVALIETNKLPIGQIDFIILDSNYNIDVIVAAISTNKYDSESMLKLISRSISNEKVIAAAIQTGKYDRVMMMHFIQDSKHSLIVSQAVLSQIKLDEYSPGELVRLVIDSDSDEEITRAVTEHLRKRE